MAKMAKEAELRTKQGPDRPLHKLYIDGVEFPYYTTVGGVSFKPCEQFAGFNEATITILVDGPVALTVVDKYEEL